MGDQIVTGLQFCIWFVQRQDGASFLDQLQTKEKQNQSNPDSIEICTKNVSTKSILWQIHRKLHQFHFLLINLTLYT